MTQYSDNLLPATAGLAYALQDFWPIERPQFDAGILQRSEQLAAGAQPGERASPTAVRSIFDRVNGWEDQPHFLPLRPLNTNVATIFPVSKEKLKGSIQSLKDSFQERLTRLGDPHDSQAWLENVLDLLQRYAWCVPAPQYGADSDVSLYDHARVTAALAVCLASGGHAEGDVALLVGGDLSGVQDWLYTLASSGAAKSLRGRSFYLQMLTEVAAYKVLDDLGLPLTNLIYVGGGNFYVLTPVGQADRVASLAREIGLALLKAHDGDLYLTMGCTPIQASEFAAGQIGVAWERLAEELNRQKQQRFASLGEAAMAEQIGVPLEQGGKPDKVCSICQRENPSGKPWQPDKDDPTIRKCGLCGSLEQLGGKLPNATHIVTMRLDRATSPDQHVNRWQDGLRALGYEVWVVDAAEATVQAPPDAVFARIGRIAPQPDPVLDQHVAYAFEQTAHAFGYRPLVNVVPRKAGAIATFDQLCSMAQGIEHWGVLRMDVDDLGKLFQEGLGKRATLSRSMSLSFALRLFFEGRLSEIGRRYNLARNCLPADRPGAEACKDKVYAMYSGGDDLFIVGAWDALPHLAHDIQVEFSRFVVGNPRITLSGGISLASERFPLYQAARQAGQAEAAAKDFERHNGHDKDALAFLGQAFGWEQFDEIWQRVAQLAEWTEARKINRSLIQTLRAIDGEYRVGLELRRRQRAAGKSGQAGQFYYGPWMWKLVYQLSRVAQQAKRAGHDDVSQWVEELRDALVEPDGPITTLGLTARWAEFLTRKDQGGPSK